MRKSRLTILPASSDSNIGEERGVTGYMSSNFRSKSYSRLYSDISAHLRVIENTCQRYTIEGHTRTDSLFQHPKHPENQHYEVNERSSSPPPPPPPLLLPSPQYSVSECHQNDSIVSPLCSPQIKNHQNLQSFLRKQLFSESNQSVALPAADTPAKPSLSHNISLDSPTGDSETKRDKFHASTHFLVPGGLSIDHPTLSPHSFNQKQ